MSNSVPAGTLLLCVDMQPIFVKAMAQPAALQQRCSLALAAAQGLGLPVIFTEQVPQKLGGTIPELRSRAPAAPALGKSAFSAFADDAIRAALAASDATHLLIIGLETPVCVYQTTIDALRNDLQVTILSDAVGARRPDDARCCLEALVRVGAHVLPVETVFYALLGSVQHPFFKSYTQLVKSHG
jgi:nicotinamidase-related amidase